MPDRTLAPFVRDRVRRLFGRRGWPRLLALRRVTAAVLVLLAVVLAVRAPQARGTPTVPVLVAARDLAPGSSLGVVDVRVARAPSSLRPAAALTDADQVVGRVLAGAASAGEPITRARLVGPENSRLSTGDPRAVAVPVRLADPAVAELLSPGARVDVVTVSADSLPGSVVLAADATVVTVRGDADDRLVVIALPREAATRVASVSLGQPVAITLR
jgi:Flp pilus assembly protein CpaB